MLVWPITPEIQNYDAAPSLYLAHLIGHEADGSLFSLLKQQGLCCGLFPSSSVTYHWIRQDCFQKSVMSDTFWFLLAIGAYEKFGTKLINEVQKRLRIRTDEMHNPISFPVCLVVLCHMCRFHLKDVRFISSQLNNANEIKDSFGPQETLLFWTSLEKQLVIFLSP